MCKLEGIMPLFIVSDLLRAVDFYCETLGFELRMSTPDPDPFFAIVARDRVGLMLKHIDADTPPMPNPARHGWAKWDAFVQISDPESLALECAANGGAAISKVHDTEDGLRGFEATDPSGYVLFFGHPITG
ncbi:MAG: VOC family protein [Planctomycetota bacterium]|nr:VOC family protein [Planctomycetota bacterium]